MGNEVSVKELILNEDELTGTRVKRRKDKSGYTYRVIMQSGCDFAIERTRKNQKGSVRLVILVSREQYYLEENGKVRRLNRNMFKSFFGCLEKGSTIPLPDVNWLDHIEYDGPRGMVQKIADILFVREYIRFHDMIRHGNFACQNEHDFGFCSNICEVRYTGDNRKLIGDFAPYAEPDVQMDEVFGNPFLPNDPFRDNEGIEGDRLFDPVFIVRYYAGYNPAKECGIRLVENAGFWMLRPSYEELQCSLCNLSPRLYEYMLSMLSERAQVSKKELLTGILCDWKRVESMLFQSFPAFVMIECSFGTNTARKAMNMYLDSGIADIIPATQMSIFLFGSRIILPLSDQNTGNIYHLKSESFLRYMFNESVRQGYMHNMNLFLYQWGQFLFLQRAMECKRVDKYPKYLASRVVELMSMIPDYSEHVEKMLWEEAVRYAEPLEYRGEKYSIIIPRRTRDIVEEAERQGNCLRSYESAILRRQTRVCFLRYTDPARADISLVTLEVSGDAVVQCKARYNAVPSIEQLEFIREWEAARSLHGEYYPNYYTYQEFQGIDTDDETA